MKTIHKYPIPISDDVYLDMPKGAEPLYVAIQGQSDDPRTARLCLWARVDPTAKNERRRFRVAGTGHPLKGNERYLGSVQLAGGDLVFHVFEVPNG